jgi:hypothetical protein
LIHFEQVRSVKEEARSLLNSLLDSDGALPVEGAGQLFMFVNAPGAFRKEVLQDIWVPMKIALAQGGRFISENKASLLLRDDVQASGANSCVFWNGEQGKTRPRNSAVTAAPNQNGSLKP